MGRGESKSNATRRAPNVSWHTAGCMTTYSYVASQSWSGFLECKFHISVGIKLKDAARSSLQPTEGTGTSSSWHAPLATWSLSLLHPPTGCPEHHPYLMDTSQIKHLTYTFGFYSKSWWASRHYRGEHWALSGFAAFIHQNLIDLPKIKVHDRAGLNASELDSGLWFFGVLGVYADEQYLGWQPVSEKSLCLPSVTKMNS